MDEVHADLQGVLAAGAAEVVAELVLLLIALYRKSGDGGDELIVAESLKAAGGERRGAEGECQCEAKIRVARLGMSEELRSQWMRSNGQRKNTNCLPAPSSSSIV